MVKVKIKVYCPFCTTEFIVVEAEDNITGYMNNTSTPCKECGKPINIWIRVEVEG